MTITVSSSARPYEAPLDAASMAAELELVQSQLAEQVGSSMRNRTQLMRELANRAGQQAWLSNTLNAAAMAAGNDAVCTVRGDAIKLNDLVNALGANGISAAGVVPKYLWMTVDEQRDTNGNVVGVSVSATWKTTPLFAEDPPSAVTVPQNLWNMALQARPDASRIWLKPSPPPACMQVQDLPRTGGSTHRSTYCFQGNLIVTVDKTSATTWAQQLLRSANAQAVQLAGIVGASRSELGAYDRIVSHVADGRQVVTKYEIDKASQQMDATRRVDRLARERDADMEKHRSSQAGETRDPR